MEDKKKESPSAATDGEVKLEEYSREYGFKGCAVKITEDGKLILVKN